MRALSLSLTAQACLCPDSHGDYFCSPFPILLSFYSQAPGLLISAWLANAHPPQLCPDHSAPSMFEPVHGSAFDIMGKGIANPIGTIWSAAMMLDWLGEKAASKRLDGAFRKAIQEGKTSGDLGGQLDTDGVARAVMERL